MAKLRPRPFLVEIVSYSPNSLNMHGMNITVTTYGLGPVHFR